VTAEAVNEPCEFQQIRYAEESAARAEDNFWIGGNEVRPLLGNGAGDGTINLQQDPCSVAAVSLTDAEKLASAEWVERMGYLYKVCLNDGMACNLG